MCSHSQSGCVHCGVADGWSSDAIPRRCAQAAALPNACARLRHRVGRHDAQCHPRMVGPFTGVSSRRLHSCLLASLQLQRKSAAYRRTQFHHGLQSVLHDEHRLCPGSHGLVRDNVQSNLPRQPLRNTLSFFFSSSCELCGV